MLTREFIRNGVPLPEDLTSEQIFTALSETQKFFSLIRENTGILLSTIIQSNNFSGVVSNVFTKKLNDVSHFKSYHDQRYPDLKHEITGLGLEVKASNKAFKGGEGHNGHSGWHIIVCYMILDDGDIEFIHVEIAQLNGFECGENSDWTYNGSRRNDADSQRTETYNTTLIGTSKLRDGSIYLNPNYAIVRNYIPKRNSCKDKLPIPVFSPFYI